MRRSRSLGHSILLPIWILSPLALLAYPNGLPFGRTGYPPEQTCEGSGCHRSFPYPPAGNQITHLTIDVGPYVPGQTQTIVVTVVDSGARSWGFQMAARLMNSPQTQAGTFSLVPDYDFVRLGCADQSFQVPCPGNQLQYASQTSLGTRSGTPSGYTTFRVNWTAPTTDVGPVLFTAAGMGADGDGSPDGDHTYTTTAVSLFAPSNQPTLNDGGVVNAAGGLSGAGISQGALISLYGQKLAPPGFARSVTAIDLDPVTGKLPLELSRTGVDFFLPNNPSPIPAYILYVGETQINAQVPALPPGFSGNIQAQVVFNRGQGTNEVRGNKVTAFVRPFSPGLFTFDGSSVAAISPSGSPVARAGLFPNSSPAHPGDIISVYGTGFGSTSPPVDPGSLAPGSAISLTNAVTGQIGGIALASSDILYAGVAPNFAGLQQFNIHVPSGVPAGDQPITLTVGGINSQQGVILTVQSK